MTNTDINKVHLWQCAGYLEREIRALGIKDIQYSTDQEKLTAAVAVMEKKALGEHFRNSLHTLPPSQCMWISAIDDKGETVAVIAARLDDTGSWTLQQYLHAHFGRVIDGANGKPATLTANSNAFAATIKGRCVYAGEGYMAPKWRGTGLVGIMFRYFALIIWDEWKPDILYSWIRRSQVMRGAPILYGVTEIYETPLQFENPPLDKDWMNTFFCSLREVSVYQMIQTLREQASKADSNSKPKK